MIEITVGITAACKAYELLKKGLAAGKEIDDMSAQVKTFFKNKQKVEECVRKAEENDQLDSLYAAIDVVTELERLEKIQNKIKWSYIDAGKSMTWQRIIREQERIERKRAAKRSTNNQDEAFMNDLIFVLKLLMSGVLLTGGILYAVYYFTASEN